VVFLIAAVVFRSFAAGFLRDHAAVAFGFGEHGLLGLLGLRLNIPVALTSRSRSASAPTTRSTCLFRRARNPRSARRRTSVPQGLRTAGKACLFVASAVAGGYAVAGLLARLLPAHLECLLIGTAQWLSASPRRSPSCPHWCQIQAQSFIFNGGSMKRSPSTVPARSPSSLWSAPPVYPGGLGADPGRDHGEEFVVTKYPDSTSETTMTLTNKAGKQRLRKTSAPPSWSPTAWTTCAYALPGACRREGTVSLLIEHAERTTTSGSTAQREEGAPAGVEHKKDSFVGTDFSYGDVIGHKVKEMGPQARQEEEVDGKPCYVIESTPKDANIKANTGYSKRVNWIEKTISSR